MACCKVCCGCAICEEGDQGKCCCGTGSSAVCCEEGEYCCNGACQETPCIDCNSPPATDSDPNISCECNSDYIGEYCGEQGDCFVTYLEPCPAFYAECCPLDCLEFQDPGGPIFLCDELP